MFNEQRPVQILELFGGIGSPRCALRNLGIPTKAIDYVEIDEKAVRSYNSMFAEELPYKTQSVVGWNLKPDILIHGSPCQDMSIAGHQGKAKAEDGRVNRGKGADQGSGTRSSLMWETIHIIEQMGKWKPKYVIWENVRNVTSRISVLGGEKFQFDELIRTPMRSIDEFLEKNEEVPEVYDVTQPSVKEVIGVTGSVRRATVIEDYAFTITTRQDRTPAQVIDCGKGRYRYLTELECWRLQGYTDEDFERAKKAQQKKGRYYTALYKQAGNSIAVPIFESIFRKIILNEVREKEEQR